MKKAKVLFVSQEINPYLELTEIGSYARQLPQGIQERGMEIRTFMPRFGVINERRNQLHEVIRLSGMNLIIDDTDHPLIIKVASIQSARMQVYFIDNEEYFQRKFVFHDIKKKFYKDNEDRTIFFCRGVLETVKKLGWAPDIIHCHGWMSSLIPFFIKTSYKEDPLFQESRIVYSLYDQDLEESFSDEFAKKFLMDGMTEEDLKAYKDPSLINANITAIACSDGIIRTQERYNAAIENFIKRSGKRVLPYHPPDNFVDAYYEFYNEILEEEPELVD